MSFSWTIAKHERLQFRKETCVTQTCHNKMAYLCRQCSEKEDAKEKIREVYVYKVAKNQKKNVEISIIMAEKLDFSTAKFKCERKSVGRECRV